MSGTRRFAWRTWRAFGCHLLDQRFDSAREAGEWRRENFGDDHYGLTLVSVDAHDRVGFVTASELCEAQWAWLHADVDNETAAGRDDTPTPAA